MAIGDRTYPWAAHTAWGYPFNVLQNVIETTGAYTYRAKKVSAATAGAVHSSITGSTSAQTITTGITNPDVPRVLAITTGGSGISAGNVVITGVNVEGKTITNTIAMNTGGGQTAGTLVFKRVTSILVPAALGATGTVTIDTTAKLGLNHRLVPNYSTIVAIHAATTSPYNPANSSLKTAFPVVEAAVSSSNTDNQFVEKNWAQPATAPDGTKFLYFFYWFYKVLVYPPKDSPDFYSTTTSTSTSSTSSSTSTSMTTTSTSSTSSSTSITTTSTSSTSTSTTTLPV
jgi:hypothetical protein